MTLPITGSVTMWQGEVTRLRAGQVGGDLVAVVQVLLSR